MGMDGLTLAASVIEVKALVGGRIDKVQQPERDELLLGIYKDGINYRLLINVSAAGCRLQLTRLKRESPAEAPMFCMLMRKRILGGKLISAEQPNLDRVVLLGIQAHNEMGDIAELKLAVEIMGKHSNAILINENGQIIDAIRRAGPGVSNIRMVMPGLEYKLPPGQGKQSPLHAQEAAFLSALSADIPVGKALSQRFYGLSPSVAAQLSGCSSTGAALEEGQRLAIAARLANFYAELAAGRFEPALELGENGEPLNVLPFAPAGADVRCLGTLWKGLDELYAAKDARQHIQRHSASVKRVLQNNIERCEKKLALYSQTLNSQGELERLRLFGELITANLHRLKQGEECVVLQNYYVDPPVDVLVPLDPRCSPSQNAQKYFKKYQKSKAAMDMAQKQKEETFKELEYLLGQQDNLDKCTTDAELSEIGDELFQLGYIRRSKEEIKRQKARQAKPSRPMCFVSSDGAEIFVGKNNRQNDQLTLKFADPEDTWLHTKDIPGSHVILKGANPSKEALFEAALLAAYYSKARGGENVPVDFTARKHVKKPSGARPGMVIYVANRTAFVTPDEELVKRIKQKA